MKIEPTSLAVAARALLAPAALFVSTLSVSAATLNAPAAVHTRPDDAAPVLSVLAAGTEPAPAPDALATTPAGWMAVELPGPFEAFVRRSDLMKSLDVKPGASLYRAPDTGSGILATSEKGDNITITGLHGKWTQVKLAKKLTGYIHVDASGPQAAPAPADTAASPEPVSPPAAAPASATTPAPMAPAPIAPSARGAASANQPAPVVNTGTSLPRYYQGKFVSTRSAFRPRRPFDWALADDAGKRIAYLDTSHLLLTEQIESYANHDVLVYGATRPSPDGKDFVIVLESLQLK